MHSGIVCLCVSVVTLAASAEQPAGWAEKVREGRRLQSQGQFAEAESRFESALHEAEGLPGRLDLQGITLSSLASVKIDMGRMDEAARDCERAISMLVKSAGEDDAGVQTLRVELAGFYVQSGQFSIAEKLLRKVITRQAKNGQSGTPETAFALDVLACLHARQRKLATAEAEERQSLSITEASPGPDPSAPAVAHVHLGIFLNSRNRTEEARQHAERGLAMLKALREPQPVMEAVAELNLASIHAREGRRNEAEAESEQALEIVRSFYGPSHPQTGWTLLARAAVLRRLDRKDEARAFQKQGERVLKESGNDRLRETVPVEALLPR